MKTTEFKIGDKVDYMGDVGVITKLPCFTKNRLYSDHYEIKFISDNRLGLCKSKEMKLIKSSIITTEQFENEEITQIVEAIDDYVWYGEGGISAGTRAKSGLVIGALVKVLVAKGLLTVQDVKRVLSND